MNDAALSNTDKNSEEGCAIVKYLRLSVEWTELIGPIVVEVRISRRIHVRGISYPYLRMHLKQIECRQIATSINLGGERPRASLGGLT